MVVQDKIPKATNAASAMIKRFTRSLAPLGISAALTSANQTWCTGKDSNLRTSQGGTDLQSVGFNHSPTCAKTPPGRKIRKPATACARRMMLQRALTQ